jgi:hypothetical protein
MFLGPRGLATGNALVAESGGDTSPFYNPALAPYVSSQRFSASASFLTNDRRLQFVEFAVPLRPRAGVAAGLIHASVSDIDGRDASGYHTTMYSTSDLAGYLAFGTRLANRVSAGLSFKYVRSDLFPDLDPSTSIALGFGVLADIGYGVSIGAAVDDLLARLEWDSSEAFGDAGRKTTDEFPARIRAGAAYRFMEGRTVLLFEYESRIEKARAVSRRIDLVGGSPLVVSETQELDLHTGLLRAGAEWRLVDAFAIRTGIDRVGGSVGETIPSFGFVVDEQLGQLGGRIEYAFGLEPFALGTMHVIGVRLAF